MLNYGVLIRYVVVFLFLFSGLTYSIECPKVGEGESYKCNFGTPQVSGGKMEMYQNTPSGSKIGNISIAISYHCNINRQLILSLTADDSLIQTLGGNSYFATNVKGIRFKFNQYSTAGGRDGRLPMEVLLHKKTYVNKHPYQCLSNIATVNLEVYYFQDDSAPLNVDEYNLSFLNEPKIASFRWSSVASPDDYFIMTNIKSLPLKVKAAPCYVTNMTFDIGLFNLNQIREVKNSAISRNIDIRLSCESGKARVIEYSFFSQNTVHAGGLVDVEKSENAAEGVAYKVEHMVTGQAFNNIKINRKEKILVNEHELSPSIKLRITPIKKGDIKPGVANIQLILTLTHS